jgi:hypothetical protein
MKENGASTRDTTSSTVNSGIPMRRARRVRLRRRSRRSSNQLFTSDPESTYQHDVPATVMENRRCVVGRAVSSQGVLRNKDGRVAVPLSKFDDGFPVGLSDRGFSEIVGTVINFGVDGGSEG